MTARVMVVDDLEPNVKLLEAKLSAEYFDVVTALSGEQAISTAKSEQPDIILLDVMMPGMDGYETCRRLKAAPETAHIPVVMVTALDQQADRIAGLEAGADDFLTKPVEDVALFARVRSLTRIKMMTDELRLRHSTIESLGIAVQDALTLENSGSARILVIDDQEEPANSLKEILSPNYDVVIEPNPAAAPIQARNGDFDIIIVSMGIESADALRLCSNIRSLEETRLTPLLTVVRASETRKLVRALEMGVNDYVTRPLDTNELEARVRTQLRRKRYIDRLRASFEASLEMAVTDTLTGLYNRRYLGSHLTAMFERGRADERTLSVLFLDIDHFKHVNDTYGHEIGDEVVREIARRISHNIRGIDLGCRYGGEEFVIVMPDTEKSLAMIVAERLRAAIADEPFMVGPEDARQSLSITVSIGLASTEDGAADDSPKALVKRADDALYEAKNAGRNKVFSAAA